ncbi:MAG: agmatine deiminase family protein [Planctomycetaceae bacterium]|nr:agmatine deiminase family protein [Planctomycetaceae bacterium]
MTKKNKRPRCAHPRDHRVAAPLESTPTKVNHRTWVKSSLFFSSLLLCSLLLWATLSAIATLDNEPRLPGEFEEHACLMLSWPAPREGTSGEQRLACDRAISQVIKSTQNRLPTLIVVPNESVQLSALEQLVKNGVNTEKIEFMQADIDRPWIRDFGPRMVTYNSGQQEVIGFQYNAGSSATVGLNQVPDLVSSATGIPLKKSMIPIAGGNLLSNGAGLAVTTESWDTRKARVNAEEKKRLEKSLKEFCGVQELIILEPLRGEPTRHVDMFVTFVAPDVVVVGEYVTGKPSHNSAVLDRNAARLAGSVTPLGPMKVHRIPMPSPSRQGWFTYTNVVFANGILIVPSFKNVATSVEKKAVAVYKSLLPDWEIELVESSSILQSGGALHCATMNLFSLGDFDLTDIQKSVTP